MAVDAPTGRSDAPDDAVVVWEPQPRQAAFISCPVDDVAFGGARGGGKSDGVIGDWVDHEDTYGASAIGMAFRRERTQLVELIERAKQILQPIGHKWHEVDKVFRGPNGGRLKFAYLENDSDADAYQGHSYTRLYPEEMGTFPTEAPLMKLQATLRSGNGVPCQMKGTCNPGGPGHQWVKARYRLDTEPQGFKVFEFDFTNPLTKEKITKRRVFIPSRVGDNKYLGADYVANLQMVGNDALVRAWLDGDWSVIEGAFFDVWRESSHVIRPFPVPRHWLRFGSFDWGFARPFSYGLWAVSDGEELPDGRRYPAGALIRFSEWYGASAPNVGLRLTAEQIVLGDKDRGILGIKDRELGHDISYRVADPACFAQDGGPSHAEQMAKAGIMFRRADNRRVPALGAMGGWDQVRGRLVGGDHGPMLYVFNTCKDTIRTLPALQHDPLRAEDIDTDGEDHAADEVRYACMSRPWTKPQPKSLDLEAVLLKRPTIDELWKLHASGSGRAGRVT